MSNQKFQSPSGLIFYLFVLASFFVGTQTQIRLVKLLVTSGILMGCIFLQQIRHYIWAPQIRNPKSINSSLPRAKWLPIRVPIIDGLISVLKLRAVGLKLSTQLFQLYGSTYKIDVGLSSVVLTSDPDHIQAVLSSNNEGHLNKPAHFYDAILTTALKDGLVGAPYKIWIKHRLAASKAFSYKSLITYLKYVNDGSQTLSAEIGRLTDKHGVIHNSLFKAELDAMAIKLISRIILGSENLILTDEERNDYNKAFSAFKNSTIERFTHPEQMVPFVWALHPNKRRLDRAISEMAKHVNKLISNYTSKDLTKANEKNDITNFSLESHTDSEYYASVKEAEKVACEKDVGIKPYECLLEHLIKASTSTKEIVDEVTTFMAAGYETLVMTMDMLLFHLAYNREAQVKCQDEVDKFLLDHFPGDPEEACYTMDHLGHLKYLERCVLESLRLAPTIPVILRWLENPLQVGKDSYLEGGQTLCLDLCSLHRNPNIYPNPEKFDPDRFLPEAVKARHSHAFMPFSLGSRNCIGWKLALTEVKVILARLVSSFEFWTTDEPNDVKLHFHITLKPERTHNVYFRRRTRK